MAAQYAEKKIWIAYVWKVLTYITVVITDSVKHDFAFVQI